MTPKLSTLLSKLKTEIYENLQKPSFWDTDQKYVACWTKYSVNNKADFEVDWKARLDYEGKYDASAAFTILNDEQKKLFPIIKIKQGSNGDLVPQ
jgi:hypothetical protein